MNIEKKFIKPKNKKEKELEKAKEKYPFLLSLFGGDYEALKRRIHDMVKFCKYGHGAPEEGSNLFLKMAVEGLDNLNLSSDDFAKLKKEIMNFYYKEKAKLELREKLKEKAKLKRMVEDARFIQLRERKREGAYLDDIDYYSGEIIEYDEQEDQN